MVLIYFSADDSTLRNIQEFFTLEKTRVPLEVTSKEPLQPVFEVTSQSGTLFKIAFLSEFAREAYPHPPQYSIWIANFILKCLFSPIFI